MEVSIVSPSVKGRSANLPGNMFFGLQKSLSRDGAAEGCTVGGLSMVRGIVSPVSPHCSRAPYYAAIVRLLDISGYSGSDSWRVMMAAL